MTYNGKKYFADRTWSRFLKKGEYILEERLIAQKKFLWFVYEEIMRQDLYLITHVADRHGAVVEIHLQHVDTKEKKIVKHSPYREITVYVLEDLEGTEEMKHG